MAQIVLDRYWPLPRRTQFISDLLKHNPEERIRIEFQGQIVNPSVHTVDLWMPVYRLSNGRTLARQQEHLAEHGKPNDFFTRDPESLEALTAQHAILSELVDEADLMTEMRDNRQTEPLILTREGYVVNGNRRLCAMRILFEQDPNEYGRYGHIQVVFLPRCPDRSIDELEAKLQLQRDFKAQYSWIDRALWIRDRQTAHKLSDAEVASIYGIREKEVREQLQMLADAERYLDSRDLHRHYTRLLEFEYVFRPLVQQRSKCRDAAEEDLFTELIFRLLDAPPERGRLYEKVSKIQANLGAIQSSLGAELGAPTALGAAHTTANASPIAAMLGGKDNPGPHHTPSPDLTDLVAQDHNLEAVLTVVRDVLEEAEQTARAAKTQSSFREHVRAAGTSLERALNSLSSDSIVTGTDRYLADIEETVQKIRSRLRVNADDRL